MSNESAQKVFFDNLVIHHNRGTILQTDNYYPFGLTMAGISDQAYGNMENKFLYNGIELNHKEFSDGTGLELYTAHFRGLDPQIGRWWQEDPKADYDFSPYSAMDLNPIKFNDIFGDTVIGNLQARQEYLSAINKGINQGLNKVNRLFQKSLHSSGNKLKRLDRRIANAQGILNGFVTARNEYHVLDESTQNYKIETGLTNLSSSEYGKTDYNPATNDVNIKVSATAPNPLATLAHELKHAYQYETGEVSLMYNGGGSGPLTDLYDELAAFHRGQLFGDNTSINFTIPLLHKMYPLDPIGPININTPYTATQSYGEAINSQLFSLGAAGKEPFVIVKNWQLSYTAGLISNILFP